MVPFRNIPDGGVFGSGSQENTIPTKLNPWFAGLIGKDAESIARAIEARLAFNGSPELAPLIAHVAEFIPHRLCYCGRSGYVLCLKRTALGQTQFLSSDFFYLAQPLSDAKIRKRVKYFDETLRPLMSEFFSKFAGCGEQMEMDCAGQFPLNRTAIASEVAYYEPEKLGEWRDAVLIYAASTGDSLFINPQGATAWHCYETNELIPSFDSFPQFIKHYVESRGLPTQFDSWSSRELLQSKRRKRKKQP